MKGTFDKKTKKYIYKGIAIEQNMTDDEIQEELEKKQIEGIKAEGGTYLERYAKELGVKQFDLLQNILANNSMIRFTSVKSYEEFKMLKQTLVEDVRSETFANLLDTIDLYTKAIVR